MTISLSGQNVVVSSSTHTWADLVALGSTNLISTSVTNRYTNYRWNGTITVQSGATLNIPKQVIDFFRSAVASPDTSGKLKVEAGGVVNFTGCNITLSAYDANYQGGDRNQFEIVSSGQINFYESNITHIINNTASGSNNRIEMYCNTLRNVAIKGVNNSGVTYGDNLLFFARWAGGTWENVQLDQVSIELGNFTPSITNLTSRSPVYGISNWYGQNNAIVRDFVISGTPVYDYESNTTNFTQFIDSAVNLANARVLVEALPVTGEHKKGYSSNLKLVDANGNVNNALVSYAGRTNASATSNSSGIVSEFILITQETNLQGTTAPGSAFSYAQYSVPLTTVDYSSYTFTIKSYGHLAVSQNQTINSQVGTPSVPLSYGLLIDTGVTQSNTTTVSGYSGISHTTGGFTLSGSLTLSQVYDSRKLYWRNNSGVSVPIQSGTTADFANATVTINSASNLPATTAKYSSATTSGTVTLGAVGTYSATPFAIPASGVVVVAGGGTTNLQGWTFASGATINRTSGGATVVVDASQVANITAGPGVTLTSPQASVVAANFADGTRVQVAHRQVFTIASTAINTGTDVITLGNDSNGDAANFRTTSPNTLIRFTLASGATIPTSSPQIWDGGLYYWKSGGQLSITEGGSAINFSSQGSGNFILVAETEKDNSAVSGGSGYSFVLSASDRALIRVKAVHWSTASGTAKCSIFYDQVFAWSSTAGITIIDGLNNTVASSQDAIHERLVSVSTIQLEGAVINASGTSITSITPVDDGSTVSGLTLVLEGGGKVQINSNDVDGVIAWQDLYLWGCYIRSTQSGIRLASATTFVALTIYNYVLTGIEFDNTSSTPLQIVGGIGRSADGASVVSPNTTGSVIPNAISQGTGAIVTTGGSALTPTESGYLTALNATLASSGVFSSSALANAPSGGSGGLDAAGVRAAIGLASANLDTQLADLPTVSEFNARTLASAAYFDPSTDAVTVGAINTDAVSGSAIAASAVTKIQSGLFLNSSYTAPDNSGISTLLTRLSSTRAGYLDNLTSLSGVTFPANFASLGINSSGHISRVAVADSLTDKAGFSLASLQTFSTSGSVGSISGVTFPSNFGVLAIAPTTGLVSVDKTGYSLSGTQSFNLTGNITGNLSGSVGSVTGPITLPTIPNNWITAAGINSGAITAAKFAVDAIDSNALAASAVSKIQSGLSTYAGTDTSGTTALLSRLTSTRAGYLDNLSGGAVMLAGSYTAPDNSSISAIKTKTDQLAFTSGNVNAIALAGSISVSSVATNAITADSLAADAIAEIQAGLATSSQVTANGFTSSDRTALLSAQSAALAVADGRQKINYLASTFTQYNTDGSPRKVFDLKDQDGNAATSAQTAIDRIPQ